MRSAAKLELVRGSIATATTLAHERTLPVAEQLTKIIPAGGLQRGSNLAVHGVGATSFALALAGQAVRQGSFLAVIAPPSFSLASCLDFDIPLRRVVQFVLPNNTTNWAQAVAAVVEGFDIVVLADRHRVAASQARQLVVRNRERGSVLVRVGGAAWPEAADLRFDVGSSDWSGLGLGHGHLRARQVMVQVAGRRHHGANRKHQIMLPAVGGGLDYAPATISPAAAAGSGQRFAGADVDAMLDVVDGPADTGSGSTGSGSTGFGGTGSGGTGSGGSESAGGGSAPAAESDVIDLNATA